MFKGLITKTVKDMLIDPIMNPSHPATEEDNEVTAEASAELRRPSEHDPEVFDAPPRAAVAFDPDSFDARRPPKTAAGTGASRLAANPAESRAQIAEEWDIDLPFYPGEGTACGDQCRCSWRIEKRWSADNGCQAIFATWVFAQSPDVCDDCVERSQQWQDVFVRPVFD